MTSERTCEWRESRYRRYVWDTASVEASEYLPGCRDEKAWDEPPRFCPHCGGKVEVAKAGKGSRCSTDGSSASG